MTSNESIAWLIPFPPIGLGPLGELVNMESRECELWYIMMGTIIETFIMVVIAEALKFMYVGSDLWLSFNDGLSTRSTFI